MIVCVCNSVSDRHIRRAADQGVVRLSELTETLSVGSCCGKCLPMAEEILSESRMTAREMVSAALPVFALGSTPA